MSTPDRPCGSSSAVLPGFSGLDAGEMATAARHWPRVDHHVIRGVLGQGGMGAVYLADQLHPVRRTVALKVMKGAPDSAEFLARFAAEKDTLSLLDHPHIAKVYDAGTTHLGQPYFTMEYVSGEAITRFCDRCRLDIRQRLQLFGQVCHALQHAHQRGVIHRDLKPTNILVCETETGPAPRLIDFGLAKLVDRPDHPGGMLTQVGQLIGTPEYMSPEQIGMDHRQVDVRSDIYALGVLLYELLTGVLPFDAGRLREAALAEVQRLIREETPPPPSLRLQALGDSAAELAQTRGSATDRLQRQLGAELEWIPMRAMAKEPDERYQSALGLARDVERYLAGDPLEAGPPSLAYRARKYWRKHRLRCLVAGLVVLLIVNTGWISLFSYWRARQAVRDLRAAQADYEVRTQQRLALTRQVAFVSFLAAWRAGDRARARQWAAFLVEGREQAAAGFLLAPPDNADGAEAFLARLAHADRGFGAFVAAEWFDARGQREQARAYYQRCLETTGTIVDEAWWRAPAEAALAVRKGDDEPFD